MKKLKITINNVAYMVTVEEDEGNALQAVEPQGIISRPVSSRPSILPLTPRPAAAKPAKKGGSEVTAPMPGVVMSVRFKKGDKVNIGDVVLVLEAMKMENEITAKKAGFIKEINVQEGQTATAGEVLMTIE